MNKPFILRKHEEDNSSLRELSREELEKIAGGDGRGTHCSEYTLQDDGHADLVTIHDDAAPTPAGGGGGGNWGGPPITTPNPADDDPFGDFQ